MMIMRLLIALLEYGIFFTPLFLWQLACNVRIGAKCQDFILPAEFTPPAAAAIRELHSIAALLLKLTR